MPRRFRKLFVTPLEDRCTPASTAFSGGTLSIDFLSNENVTLTNAGGSMTFSGTTFTGAGAGPFTGVSKISVADSTTETNRTLNINGTAYSLTLGLQVLSLERVNVNAPVTVTANGTAIQIATRQGVTVAANLTTTGSSNIVLSGGDFSDNPTSNTGVAVSNAVISSGGTLTVNGRGGFTGSGAHGVLLSNAQLKTAGSTISVNAQANGAAAGNTSLGLIMESGSLIQAGGTASVTVVATGGAGTHSNTGIHLNGVNNRITSSGGDVGVYGTGGGGSSIGVRVSGGAFISAGGAGTVTVEGTAGISSVGVGLETGGSITTSGGLIDIKGTSDFVDVGFYGGGTHALSVGSAPITITADTIAFNSAGTNIDGLGNIVTLQTRTLGKAMILGDLASSVDSLSQTELNTIKAGTLRIGRNDGTATGPVTIAQPIVLSHIPTLSLRTGAGVTGTGSLDVGALAVRAAGTVSLLNANNTLNTFAAAITAGGDVAFADKDHLYIGAVDGLEGVNAAGSVGITTQGFLYNQKASSAGTGFAFSANMAGLTAGSFDGLHIDAPVSAGNGTLTLEAKSGNSSGGGQYGVYIQKNVTTSGGDIVINGTSRGTGGGNNYGVVIHNGAQVKAGGIGTVSITAAAGKTAGDSNYGLYILNAGTLITSSGGDVILKGTGGGTGISDANFGVTILDGAVVSAGGMGNVTVTGQGGTTAADDNYGVDLRDNNTLITSSGGNVTVTGTGGGTGSTNIGVHVRNGADITTGGNGSVAVIGTAANGLTGGDNHGVLVQTGGSTIKSSGGSVSVTGTGGGSTIGNTNIGVFLANNGVITAGGTGAVTVTGTGGTSSGLGNWGVNIYNGGFLTSGGGDVKVTGTGRGTGQRNYGVFVEANSNLSAGGTGSVTVEGQGSTTGTGPYNYGVHVVGTAATIFSNGGNVSVTGKAGGTGGSSSDNFGVYLLNKGVITAGGSGTTTVTGTGGAAGGNFNYGVRVYGADSQIRSGSGGGDVSVIGIAGGTGSSAINFGVSVEQSAVITAGGSGAVSVTGLGGPTSGNDQYGVTVADAGSKIASGGGPVTVTGTGGGSSASNRNYGVFAFSGGGITSGGSGSVTIVGKGGLGTGDNHHGVYVSSANSSISSGGGDVTVTGTAGGTGASAGNHGVNVQFAGVITAAGSGKVIVNGSGGLTTGQSNFGVILYHANSKISSAGGDVTVNGTGGGAGSSVDNEGVMVGDFATLTAGGTGNVAVTGTVVPGASVGGHGVYVLFNGTVSSSGGNVSVTGTSSTGATGYYGVSVFDNGTITAGGAGTVTVHGTALGTSIGGSHHGVIVHNSGANSAKITSSGGAINVTGSSTFGAGFDVLVRNTSSIANSGGLTVTADSFLLEPTATIGGSAANVTLRTRTPGTKIDLGGADAVGVLGLTDAELDRIDNQSALLRIGRNDATPSGDVTVSAAVSPALGARLVLRTGGAVAGAGPITENFLMIHAGGAVTLTGGNAVSGFAARSDTAAVTFNSTLHLSLITLDGVSGVQTPGGAAALSSATAISVDQVVTAKGDVTLLANTGGAGTGNVTGINVFTAVTSQAGNITMTAQSGGSGGVPENGIRVFQSVSAPAGKIALTGTSRATTGSSNHGILIENGADVNAGGNVEVFGTGAPSTGGNNHAVQVRDAGTTVVAGGNLTVNGNARGAGTAGSHYGVHISGGAVVSGGSASVHGSGGTGTGGNHHGVLVTGADSRVTATGGSTFASITGLTPSLNSIGVILQSGSTVNTTSSGSILLMSNSMLIHPSATVNSGAAVTTLRPLSNTTVMSLGSVDASGVLGLTDAELDRITAGLVIIGGTGFGNIEVVQPVTHDNNLQLETTGEISGTSALTMAADKSLTVMSKNTIALLSGAVWSTAGTGSMVLTTTKNVQISGGTATTVNGSLNVYANTQTVPTAGEYIGILVQNGLLEVTGNGGLNLDGRGGSGASSQVGVFVGNNGTVRGGTLHPATLTGRGGGTGGNFHRGLELSNSGLVTSLGAPVVVTGTGGADSGGSSEGVAVSNLSTIAAGGSAPLTVTGTGGAVSSGVFIHSGNGTHTQISAAGQITLTGLSNDMGLRIQSLTRVQNTADGPVTLVADRMNFDTGAVITSGAGQTTLRPLTTGRDIVLGGGDGVALGLTDAELDLVAAGILQIGGPATGEVRVAADITRPTPSQTTLTGGRVLFTGGSLDTGGGTLTVQASDHVRPDTSSGIDAAASTLLFTAASTLRIEIDGPTHTGVGGHRQLSVNGQVNLTGVSLDLVGAYAPVFGNVFTIVAGSGRVGEFTGLPENSVVPFNGRHLRVNYTPTAVTLTVLPGVSALVVNGGGVQRSRLTAVTVTLDPPQDVSTLGAIAFTRTASTASGTVGTVIDASGGLLVSPTIGLTSSLTLTFADISSSGINNASLSDGRWRLSLPGNGYLSPLNGTSLRRLFGDSDNNGTVDAADLSFFPAFGAAAASPFDFNNNGDIDSGTDLSEFGNRFGLTL